MVRHMTKSHPLFILVLAVIVGLTGVQHTLVNYGVLAKAHPIVNVIIAILLCAGCFGLFNMYESASIKDEQRRCVTFLVGLLLVLIAFVALEGLLREYGRI